MIVSDSQSGMANICEAAIVHKQLSNLPVDLLSPRYAFDFGIFATKTCLFFFMWEKRHQLTQTFEVQVDRLSKIALFLLFKSGLFHPRINCRTVNIVSDRTIVKMTGLLTVVIDLNFIKMCRIYSFNKIRTESNYYANHNRG